MKTRKVIKNPVVIREEQDGRIVYIKFVDGKQYKLQHPGNRAKMEWDKKYFNFATGIDMEGFLDAAFESVVIPEAHDKKPNIDSVTPWELEAWQETLKRFLDGGLNFIEAAERNQKENPAISK